MSAEENLRAIVRKEIEGYFRELLEPLEEAMGVISAGQVENLTESLDSDFGVIWSALLSLLGIGRGESDAA